MDVTESQLATALEGFYVRVRSTAGGMGTSSAELADADEVAKALYATLGRMAALREPGGDKPAGKPWIADTEIAAIARTVDDLDLISDTVPGVTSGSVWRVLHYLADRYGYVLATED